MLIFQLDSRREWSILKAVSTWFKISHSQLWIGRASVMSKVICGAKKSSETVGELEACDWSVLFTRGLYLLMTIAIIVSVIEIKLLLG